MRERMIVGLGNPMPYRYWHRDNPDFRLLKEMQQKGLFTCTTKTRHNAGSRVVTAAAQDAPFYYTAVRNYEEAAALVRPNTSLLLVCPQTGMNTSGTAVKLAMEFYNLNPAQILLVYDEKDLPLGKYRFQRGSDKLETNDRHNGVLSVMAELKSNMFDRLRVGVGLKPEGERILDFVLSEFPMDLRPDYETVICQAADAARFWAANDVEAAMRKYN